jgi:hypothetical protein
MAEPQGFERVLNSEEREAWTRVAALMEDRIVGVRKAGLIGQLDGQDVVVLVGVVHADMTEKGETEVVPEAILLTDDLRERLVMPTAAPEVKP